MPPSRWLALTMSLAFLFPAAGHALPKGTRVDPKLVLEVSQVKVSVSSFEDLSALLYGGDRSYANLLRSLNPEMRTPDRSRPIRYAAPKARLRSGQTLQVFGAYWAGGSARSYRALLPLNPWIRNKNDVPVGSWITLPALPTAGEREKFRASYRAKNVKAKNEEPESEAPSIYDPQTPTERLELVQWYLERIDLEKEGARAENLVKDLLRRSPGDWNSYYVAGQLYLRTQRPDRASEQFEIALRDPKAPIQAALFYLRASAKAEKDVGAKVRATLYARYPALESLLESEKPE